MATLVSQLWAEWYHVNLFLFLKLQSLALNTTWFLFSRHSALFFEIPSLCFFELKSPDVFQEVFLPASVNRLRPRRSSSTCPTASWSPSSAATSSTCAASPKSSRRAWPGCATTGRTGGRTSRPYSRLSAAIPSPRISCRPSSSLWNGTLNVKTTWPKFSKTSPSTNPPKSFPAEHPRCRSSSTRQGVTFVSLLATWRRTIPVQEPGWGSLTCRYPAVASPPVWSAGFFTLLAGETMRLTATWIPTRWTATIPWTTAGCRAHPWAYPGTELESASLIAWSMQLADLMGAFITTVLKGKQIQLLMEQAGVVRHSPIGDRLLHLFAVKST